MRKRQKYSKIEKGELKDDYKNHFLSHFGFYDENRSDYGYGKYLWNLETPKELR